MLLRVRGELEAAFSDRPVQADRGQRVLQWLARSHMHEHLSRCNDLQCVTFRDVQHNCAMQVIERAGVKCQAHPAAVHAKCAGRPLGLCVEPRLLRREIGREDDEAVGQRAQMRVRRIGVIDVMRVEQVGALSRACARKRNEFREIAVPFAVLRDRGKGERRRPVGVRHTKMRADQQFDARFLCRDMRANDPRKRTLVGNGDRLVSQLRCARDQFLGVRSALQEGEVGRALQLGIAGQAEGTRSHDLPEQSVQKPARLIVIDRADPFPENPVADVIVAFGHEVIACYRLALKPTCLNALA